MNILYLTSACSQSRFDAMVENGEMKKMPQAQKYHHLLLEGLRNVFDDDLTVVSSYPAQGKNQRVFPLETECEDGITYVYPKFVNFPIIRQLLLWINTVRIINKYVKNNNAIIVCDVLNKSICYAARYVRLIRNNIKIIGIVTDVPGHTSGARAKLLPWWRRSLRRCSSKLTKNSVRKYDGYLLLTEAMNEVVNPKHKPHIVIEGHSDVSMKNKNNLLENKTKEKTIMYAGGTHKEFGMAMLVEAFLALNNPEWVLHIYGDGNYQNELKKIAAEHKNVVYHGMRPNADVVEAQIKAWLTVNPRITNAEYVKYSFPSKTLECMVSGTPLLTTRLAGMPSDYYPYVYLFDEESIEGFMKVLTRVFSLSAEELHQKGVLAKDFAINQKNNVKQAELFYSFIEKVYNDN